MSGSKLPGRTCVWRKLWLACAIPLLLTIAAGAPAHATSEDGLNDALILLNDIPMEEVYRFLDEWEERGAWLPHIYPPNLVIGDLPADLDQELRADQRVETLYRKPMSAFEKRTAPAAWGDVITSWLIEEERAPMKRLHEKSDVTWDELGVHTITKPRIDRSEYADIAKTQTGHDRRFGRLIGGDIFNTSEWVLGRTAVGIILPEVVGATHSSAERSAVYEEVRAAFGFIAAKVTGYPRAQFVYDIPIAATTTHNFHTTPPDRGESAWVKETMASLGYHWEVKGIGAEPVWEYLDTLRTNFKTEWGITLFLPKVSFFRGAGYTAYAYLGGPYLVAPSGSGGFVGQGNPTTLSGLIVHEGGHLFYTLDEYASGGTSTPCRAVSGYLGVPNSNSLNQDWTCQQHVACAMASPSGKLCSYSLGQMAVVDSDSDGIADVIDTYPWIRMVEMPDTIITTTPVWAGSTQVQPLISQSVYSGTGAIDGVFDKGADPVRKDLTFNTIKNVKYKIDDGSWQFADPPEGWGGDFPALRFQFVPDSLSGGPHTVSVRAVNTIENESFSGFEDHFDVFVKAIALHNFAVEPDNDGQVRISFNIFGGAFGSVATLTRIAPDGSTHLVGGNGFVLQDDAPYIVRDEDPVVGVDYTYRLTIRGLGLKWEWEESLIAPAPIQKEEYLSSITPNPFTEQTVISYRVPRGARRGGGSGGGKPSGGNDEPEGDGNAPPPSAPAITLADPSQYHSMRVELGIYNVAGRQVRSYPPVHLFDGIHPEPVFWDGRNDAGESVSQGVYFVRLKAGDDVEESRKIILIR